MIVYPVPGPGHRAAVWTFPGHDPRTPGRTRFNTGIAYSVWGVGDEVAETLGDLAGHLAAHAARVIPCRRHVVVAVLAGARPPSTCSRPAAAPPTTRTPAPVRPSDASPMRGGCSSTPRDRLSTRAKSCSPPCALTTLWGRAT